MCVFQNQIDGLNWEVIKAIALEFELHPLALEDAVKYAPHSLSKADWYSDQLFTRLLIHTLCKHSFHPTPEPPSPNVLDPILRLIGVGRDQRRARDVLDGDLEGGKGKEALFGGGEKAKTAGETGEEDANGDLDGFDGDDDEEGCREDEMDDKLEEVRCSLFFVFFFSVF